ncbi:hypothetical protein SAMN02910292_02851 [Lachnospiraceae bacterium XBB2008]|nr:hypothetical protein SAMN02910292_02851 [Lachnospiraceae bacterium XBB2008]
MKRLTPILLTTTMLLLTSCGSSTGGNTGNSGSDRIVEEIPQEAGQESTQGSTQEPTQESTQESPQETNQASSHEIYERFIAGDEKAVYAPTGADETYYTMSTCLNKGEAYSLDEIITKLCDQIEPEWEVRPTVGETEYSYIDCGLDGIEELCVVLNLPIENIEGFYVQMIVKDFGGELRICYNCDSWSRSYTSISPTGFISLWGSNGAASHACQYSYVNADGIWKQWYKLNIDHEIMGEYYTYDPVNYKVLDFSGVDYNRLTIESYEFMDEPDSPEYYFTYYYTDDMGNPIDDAAIYEESDPIRQVFDANDCEVCTPDGIAKLLDSRKQEIGLTDAIIADGLN